MDWWSWKKSKNIFIQFSMIIRRESCLAVYAPNWTSKWDTCAGDAIIRSMGGHFTNRYGQLVNYDPK